MSATGHPPDEAPDRRADAVADAPVGDRGQDLPDDLTPGGPLSRVAEQLRVLAAAVSDPALPADLRRSLGRRLAAVGDLAKKDVLLAEKALQRLRNRLLLARAVDAADGPLYPPEPLADSDGSPDGPTETPPAAS